MPHPNTPRANGAGPETKPRLRWISLANYAENRDSWPPSERNRVDRDLRCGDGDEQWVRTSSSEETEATWHDGQRGALDGHWEVDGEPVTVTHVGVPDSRSGAHDASKARRLLIAPVESYELWDMAARETGQSWADWARHALTVTAAREMRVGADEALEAIE